MIYDFKSAKSFRNNALNQFSIPMRLNLTIRFKALKTNPQRHPLSEVSGQSLADDV
ncbi:MAG: hypothetical protein JWM04_2567 [Verrucomicrobiales bacterium]|nr:hypothetical protein [Verrucomicrobiales bacterium]